MSNAQHTPGPWAERNGRIFQEDRPTLTVGHVAYAFDGDYSPANARLIAAAPDLLEALKIAQQFMSIASDWNIDEAEINGQMRSTYDWLDVVNKAIAKATGETK